MLTRLRARSRDERGMALVYTALGLMAFLSASTLAIDVGMFMTARSQAQIAADAGALAGAVALVFDDPNDQSSGGPAVQNAIMAATANQVMGTTVSVTTSDVTFPAADQVQVNAFRTSARGNPLNTLIGAYFGLLTADVDTTATAEAALANAATCIKPWAIPDKWTENQTPPWDPSDEFAAVYQNGPNRGSPLPNADVFVPPGQPGYTGYDSNPLGPDYGQQVVLKPGNPHQAMSASHFLPIALPPSSGGSWYEQNIPGCWPGVAVMGDMLPVEPGNMTGPTTAGTQNLINRDPTAYWDAGAGQVVSSLSPSPRIIVIPAFDPMVYDVGRVHGRIDLQISNFVGFFVEAMQGNDVRGRVVPMTGLIRNNGGGSAPQGSFLRAIRLIN